MSASSSAPSMSSQSSNDAQNQQQLENEQSDEWQATTAPKIKKVSEQAAKAQRSVTLNVSGQRFQVSLETLMNEQDAFFSVMFSSEQLGFASPVDENTGEVFIDRDATHFPLILDHMRGINVLPRIDELNDEEKQQLEEEVDFYQLQSLYKLLRTVRWMLDETKKHRNLVLTQNADGSSTIAQEHPEGEISNDPVLGNKALSFGVQEWSVRLDETAYVLIGVCRLDDMNRFINRKNNPYCNMVWGVDCYRIWTQPGVRKETDVRWSNGSVVHVKLDCDNGKLTVGDVEIEVHAGEELYPVFVVQGHGKITLLPQCS